MASSPPIRPQPFLNAQQTAAPSRPASFSNSTTSIISSLAGITAAEALPVLITFALDALLRECQIIVAPGLSKIDPCNPGLLVATSINRV
jgi:hypothetical protein